MSTRGAVAWGNLEHWKGIYNHFDSYPGGLGKDVWDRIKEVGAAQLVKVLTKSRSWEDSLRGGRCPYCGQKATPGGANLLVTPFDHIFDFQKKGIEGIPEYQRESFIRHTNEDVWLAHQKKIRGDLWDKTIKKMGAYGEYDSGYKHETDAGLEVIAAFKKTGYPDPEMKHHSHVESPVKDSFMTEKTSDKLFIEWVYIIDIEAGLLHVLANARVGEQREDLRQVGPAQELESRPESGVCYAHYHMASVPLSNDEFPDIPLPYDVEEDD